MLVLNDVSKSYGDKQILNNVSFSLNKNEVVGLVGENGAGKTTVFKLIAGLDKADDGNIDKKSEVIGYLPQNPEFNNKTVGEFLVTSEDYKIDIALEKLGLEGIGRDQKCESLSGGQKTRLYIASLLLMEPTPTTLLLDEPTNNLDIEALDFLESFVKSFRGSIFLTSHDRYFLDKVANKILELKNGEIKVYGGNYSFYKKQKWIEKEAFEKKYIAQQKKIEQVKEDIRKTEDKAKQGEIEFSSRQPYQRRKIAKGAKTAVVRKEKLEKFLESEEFLERPEKRKDYNFGFEGETHSGKLILEISKVTKSFGAKKLINDISFSVRGDEHVLIAGTNGSGKTTLLKLITGELERDSGEITFGAGVKFGYFSQDFIHQNLNNTGIEELKSSGANATDCYTFASYIHLNESDLHKPIKALSRGQVAKLEFAKLLLSNNELLILDEPTNHLEIETREEIEEALKGYKGAILVASHDRYFVESLGTDKTITLN